MKITFKKAVFYSLLALTATGCQKEVYESLTNNDRVETVINVVYSINGEFHCEVLHGEDAWQAFIDRMLALAREGYDVVFSRYNNTLISQSKEVVTYTTKSESDAHDWANSMAGQGYFVEISYDSKTGIYTCTAFK